MKRFGPRNSDSLDRVPVLQLLPNMVTLAGMCVGLTSIRFAMDERFGAAVVLILLAAVMDGLDGLIARRLQATSEIGAQLDSLSDFLCFGVAPAVLIYKFLLAPAGSLGWIFVLVFAAATCLRLARFNVMSGKAQDVDTANTHFLGVPAPAGAMLGLLPAFATLGGVVAFDQAPLVVAVWIGIVAVLMISKLRTLSPKAIRVPRRLIGPIMFATVIGIGLTFSRPWLLLLVLDLVYLGLVLRSLIEARGRLFG
ncbi:CDP-alcohol phosphatidyltransferase family protein [Rhodovulum euryhalinum]|uniref:CDP-diacylglycerol--serine O-phosphatidyltransferase n=1 Tax=Rhodovulum euryhalinum TaxID=35805 RepID=A0A4R2KIZ0_9RHOB|nr:phosphatidylcholine/phosphatidylserine synthase [Rhodovulum euryhalinum]TCO72377.1 CDP-diacylglycerol--serine O-phosphatidyltransferase [Rhodovulum euryhalinum]